MTPAVYRKYARECLVGAAKAKSAAERQALIDTANMWTRAALQMEGVGNAEFVPASQREAENGDAR
jgi:hypothetical protein